MKHRGTDTGLLQPLCSIRLNCQLLTKLECVLVDADALISSKAEVAGVTFSDSDSAPAPLSLNPVRVRKILYLNWESDSCPDSRYYRCNGNSAMFLLKKLHLEDHAHSCYCRKWQVTPDSGRVFHKFLTLAPKEKRRILAELTPVLRIRGHLWSKGVRLYHRTPRFATSKNKTWNCRCMKKSVKSSKLKWDNLEIWLRKVWRNITIFQTFLVIFPWSQDLEQWFPNCGTRTSNGARRPSRWYTNRPTFCFSSQKNIFTAIIFTCRVMLINSWIFVWPTSLLGF